MSRTPPEPARGPIPRISITQASGPSQAEQPVINQQGSSVGLQSQCSYSIIDSEDYGSLCSQSDDLDHSDEPYYHDEWHNSSTENPERKPRIEESFEELSLSSSPRAHAEYIDRIVTAPFRDGGLPALNKPGIHTAQPNPRIFEQHGEGLCFQGDKDKGQHVFEKPTTFPVWSSKHSEETLQDRVYMTLEGNRQTNKRFFPAKSLSRIFDEETVYMELQTHLSLETYDRDQIWTMAQKVCGTCCTSPPGVSFRKIFAILVVIEKTPAIVKFLDQDINDSDLPLEAVYCPPSGRLISEFRRSKTKDGKVDIKLFRDGWSTVQKMSFEEKQWTTLAPIFERSDEDKTVLHYSSLGGKIPLPFLKGVSGEEEFEHEGGGGRVFTARIHPDHHSFHYTHCPFNSYTVAANRHLDGATPSTDTCPCHFAVKKLHSSPYVLKHFKNEVDVLRRFSNGMNNHLISLLATYEHNGNYYLIFPLAEANLKTYWQEINPNPKLDRETVLWVAEQCKGIAHGVLEIHQYETGRWNSLEPKDYKNTQFGHHGDIKPENILWFQNRHESKPGPSGFQAGTLRLTDFGLAAINTDRTISRNLFEFPCSRDYCAPEADLGNCGPPGRQYDMWTLGCVYLEIATWMIGGWSLLDRFTHSRRGSDHQTIWTSLGIDTAPFFELQPKGLGDPEQKTARVKPLVTKFFNTLHCHRRCTEFLHDFLDMIQEGLLIVRDNGNGEFRFTIEQVHYKLADMLKRCKEEESYSDTPCPRPSRL